MPALGHAGLRRYVDHLVTDDFDTGLAREDLDPRRPAPIETPWGSMAVFVVGAELFAAQSFCPHLQGPLFQGTVTGEDVVCPWHQWRFSLRSGRRLNLLTSILDERCSLLVCNLRIGPRGTILLSHPHRQ